MVISFLGVRTDRQGFGILTWKHVGTQKISTQNSKLVVSRRSLYKKKNTHVLMQFYYKTIWKRTHYYTILDYNLRKIITVVRFPPIEFLPTKSLTDCQFKLHPSDKTSPTDLRNNTKKLI